MNNELTLDKACDKAQLKITRICGDCKMRLRLLQMGITPGTKVQVLRLAPLSDPIELKIRGTTLALRRQECKAIAVTEGE